LTRSTAQSKVPKRDSWSLSALYNPLSAERHPLEALLIGLIYSIIAVGLSMLLFTQDVSSVMIAITVVATLPLAYNVIKLEAAKRNICTTEGCMLNEHRKGLNVLMLLFAGFVIGYLVWFLILPAPRISHVFASQLNTILTTHTATGQFIGTDSVLVGIIANNLRIIGICFLFSVLFGAGALFILSWNASVMATAIGSAIRTGLAGGASVFPIAYTSLARYLTHGIPEIAAYFLAGLAGGILYHATINKRLDKAALKDIATLTVIAILLVICAGLIEVYLTPAIVGG